MPRIAVILIAMIGCVSPPPAQQPAPPAGQGGGYADPPPGDPEDSPADQPPSPPDAGPPPPDASPDPAVLEQRRREAQWAALEAEAADNPTRLVGMASATTALQCGGAAPPPDQPSSAVSPYGGTLLVRKGNKNSARKPVAVVQPRAGGIFAVDLPPGTYCIVGADKRDKPKTAPGTYTDLACMQQRWQTCDGVVEHPSRKALAIDFYSPCFGPCYRGPYPP